MYQPTRVAWKIVLDKNGVLKGLISLGGEAGSSKRGIELLAPTLVRTVAIKAKLLCDNGEYALGVGKSEERGTKVSLRHKAFAELVHKCAVATSEPAVQAVDTFLQKWDSENWSPPAGFEANDTVTFEVAGVLPIDLESVRRFWATHTFHEKETGGEMMCLVCGEHKPPEERHPKKIKGVPGGQTSGTSMISANSDAFESFGVKASLIAPTCRDCAEAFADALNGLLADARSRLYVGPVVYVFWTRGVEGQDIFRLLDKPSPEDVRALLTSPSRGRDVSDLLRPANFFLVALSASGGRVVVRDYLETSVEDVQANLARWFKMLRLSDDDSPLGLFALAKALVLSDLDELSPSLLSELGRAAVSGGRAPRSLLQVVARRNRAEGGPTRPRAALTRLTLLSNPEFNYTEDRLMQLEQENDNPAYLCGRLFAELANAQRAALGDTNSTIVERYYGTASSAPATVFGTLLRGGQAHLAKLRQERPGAHVAIEQRIQEITARLPAFPSTLSLHDQALFSLGFYHQRAANATRAKERAAAKKASTASASSVGDDLNE